MNFESFARRATANRRQLLFMGLLLAIALLMWGRVLLTGEPQSAVADAQEDAGAQAPVVDPLHSRQTVFVELSDLAPRDLFQLKTNEFSKVDKPIVIPPPNSPAEKSDEARRAEMSATLATVRLQSTIMSEQPAALINDRLFQQGQEPVPGFTLTRITQHSVFLKRIGTEEEFELRMYRN